MYYALRVALYVLRFGLLRLAPPRVGDAKGLFLGAPAPLVDFIEVGGPPIMRRRHFAGHGPRPQRSTGTRSGKHPPISERVTCCGRGPPARRGPQGVRAPLTR